jgi:hypothetical protein
MLSSLYLYFLYLLIIILYLLVIIYIFIFISCNLYLRCVMVLCKVKNPYYFGVIFNIPRSQMVNLSCSLIYTCQNLIGY